MIEVAANSNREGFAKAKPADRGDWQQSRRKLRTGREIVHGLPDGEMPSTTFPRLGDFRGRRVKMINHPNRAKKKEGPTRTTQGLRDILFDEIDELRTGAGDPTKSLAVANLAKQIINTAKVELDFHRVIQMSESEGKPVQMGSLQLGSGIVAAAAQTATGH